MENEFWVFVEYEHGEIREASLEMLGEACRLAKSTSAKVCALLLGHEVSNLTDDLIAYGAQVIYQFDDERLKMFDAETYLYAMGSLKKGHSPTLIFFASTPNGMSLAPRLAARFKGGYVANAVNLSLQPDQTLRITRSVMTNKVHAVLSFPENAVIVLTIKPGSVGVDRPNKSRTGEVIPCALPDLPESHTAVSGYLKADPKVVPLDEAERVIAGGNGLRSKEDIHLLWELSAAIRAAVGGSKPVFDKGWLPHSRLVGQSSGRRISPQLFIGAGISGTNYFLDGMKESRNLIAINQDKGAPLMKMADLAVVGDLYQVLPELTRQLNERQGNREK